MFSAPFASIRFDLIFDPIIRPPIVLSLGGWDCENAPFPHLQTRWLQRFPFLATRDPVMHDRTNPIEESIGIRSLSEITVKIDVLSWKCASGPSRSRRKDPATANQEG